MGLEKLRNLPAIIVLRDLVRKWWGLPLLVATPGSVAPVAAGAPADPAGRGACEGAPGGAGYPRIAAAWHEFHAALAAAPAGSPVLRACPHGLALLAVPVRAGGRHLGAVLAEGFVAPGGAGPAGVVRLDAGDLGRLGDLLVAAADALARRAGPPPGETGVDGLVGASPALRAALGPLDRIAAADAPVLVVGESGTGKELVARAIHARSGRRAGPFVVANASALAEGLLESALFGHRKGAFTGAVRDERGLFEAADGGTFFLDEVGDTSPALQVKLLRVLQEGTFLPVGDTVARQVDVRLIAATHKDLPAMVGRGEFREDLLYRIDVLRIALPPLRERREDVPGLVAHFLGKHGRGKSVRLADETLRRLVLHAWPGNVRELENEVARMVVLAEEGEELGPDALGPRIVAATGGAGEADGALRQAVASLERELIRAGLVRTGGNRTRLARELGISRTSLLEKIARYGLASAEGA